MEVVPKSSRPLTDLGKRRTKINGTRVTPSGMIEHVPISNVSMNGSGTSLSSSSSRLAVSQNDLVERIRPNSTRPTTTAEKLFAVKRKKLKQKSQGLKSDREKRLERASNRRNKMLLKKMIAEKTGEAMDRIERYLGVDDKSYCLLHPNQRICGKVRQYSFETIMPCKICESELVAGGKRQRRSMAPVIQSIETMHKDKRQWREKTKLMYHGIGYHSENEEDSDNVRSVGTNSTGTISAEDILAFCQTIKDDPGDEEWKKGVIARVAQVRAWDGKAALKCNPIYAKYFRMQNLGIPLEAIKQACELDGWEPSILDLDPNRPLKDTLDLDTDMTVIEKEELLWYANNSTDQLTNDPCDIHETVQIVHQAYVKRKSIVDDHIMEQNKEKDSKKCIGQDWGDVLKKPEPMQRKPARKSFEQESEASRELRFHYEEEEEEEKEAAAAAAAYLREESTLRGSGRTSTLSLPIISESGNDKNGKTTRISFGSERISSISIQSITSVQSAMSEMSTKSKSKKKKRQARNLKGKTRKGKSKKITDREGDTEDTMSKSSQKRRNDFNDSDEQPEETQDVSLRLKNVNRMLIEKDIISTSLITQIEALQSDLKAMKMQNQFEKGGQSEDDVDDLKSQLVGTQKELAVKNTIMSSLVGQVQTLQNVVEEKNMVIASQAALIENFYSQVNSKKAIIGVLEQSISNLEVESEHSRRLYERSSIRSSPSKRRSSIQMFQTQPKLNDTEGKPQLPGIPHRVSNLESNEANFERELRGSHIIAGASSPEKRQFEATRDEQRPPFEIQTSTTTPREQETKNSEEPESTLSTLDSAVVALIDSEAKTALVDGKQEDANNAIPSTKKDTTRNPSAPGADKNTVLSSAEVNEDQKRKGEDAEDIKAESKKKGKSSKKKRNGKSKEKSSDGKSGKSEKRKKRIKKDKRSSNLDPAYLRGKFKECVNKLIAINRAYQESCVDIVYQKEMENDRSSFKRSSTVMTDWIAPDDWHDYFSDDDISDGDVDEPPDTDPTTTTARAPRRTSRRTSATTDRRASATTDKRTSLVTNGRRTSLVNGQRVPRRLSNAQLNFLMTNDSILDLEDKTETPPSSPEIPSKRLSSIIFPKPKQGILRPPGRGINLPPRNNRSITWISDEIVHTETIIDRIAVELIPSLWYTPDEYKLFSFEKYMEEHDEEFEIIDSDEEDEYSYIEEESYYSDDEGIEEIIITEDSYLEIEEAEDIVEEADFIISTRSRRGSL